VEVSARQRSGLVGRPVADRWAAGVFFVVLILAILFLAGTLSDVLPTKTATIKSTEQVVTDAKGQTKRTETTETTTADVPLSVWERLLGRRTILILTFALSLLGAFVAAAAIQRVLVGHYEFTLGALALSDITASEVSEAAQTTLSMGGIEISFEPSGPEGEAAPEPIWATLDDPNLALAGWRIELEQELRRLAEENDMPAENRSAGQLLGMLMRREIIDPRAAPGLQELLKLANRGVHGASVDPSVTAVLQTQGRQVLQYLRSLSRG
jgi:hypothetical protein